MANVIKKPFSVIGLNLSKWVAAYNPCVYLFQVEDLEAKPLFRLEIQITYGTKEIVGSWSADENGNVRADISMFLQSLVNAKDSFAYDSNAWLDNNRFYKFDIGYRETYTNENPPFDELDNDVYVVYAAKQLGDKYGGNMAQYVTFSEQPNPDYKAKFLNESQRVKFWPGLPFDVSAIISEDLAGENISLSITSYNNSGQIIAEPIDSLILENQVNTIAANSTGALIASTALLPTESFDLPTVAGVYRLMIPAIPSQDVKYLMLQIFNANQSITQTLRVDVSFPCDKDPYVYLKWINKLGGWSYWRFGYRQDISVDTSNDTQIRRSVFDYENDDTILDIVKKSAKRKIQFGADGINTDFVPLLESLATSVKVMLLVSSDPIKWQTVILSTGSFGIYQTRSNKFQVQFTVSLPDINIQGQ